MANRQNPLYWSFPAGTWLGVRIRISWLMPVVAAWFFVEFGWRFGGVLFGIVFASVLLHEFGHIVAARAMGGSGDEILLWPLGGLAFVERNSAPRVQFVTAMGGPAVNVLLCLVCLPEVLASSYGWAPFYPLQLPMAADKFGARSILADLQVLTFCVNWINLLINLVPAYPLDGGQMARAWLASRFNAATAAEVSLRVAYGVSLLLAVLALFFFKSVILLGLAFLLVVLAMQESFELQAGESFDDSFMGYDFSQGYTSLERSEQRRRERKRGVFTRWLEARRLEKQRRLDEQQQQVEQQLDAILAKVHDFGMGALTPAERRTLERASNHLRSKGNGPQ